MNALITNDFCLISLLSSRGPEGLVCFPFPRSLEELSAMVTNLTMCKEYDL